MCNDPDPTDHHHRPVRAGHYAHPVFALLGVPRRSGSGLRAVSGPGLPGAIFGMLVVYCLKGVQWTAGTHGLPELIAILVTIGLHRWKRQMLLSIAGGTVCYMLLVRWVF